MNDNQAGQVASGTSNADPTDLSLGPVAQSGSEAESLVRVLTGHVADAAAKAQGIEELRVHARASIVELEAQAAAIRDTLVACSQQADSAKALADGVAITVAAIEATTAQTKEASAHASAALESIRTLLNTATSNASRIEALKVQVEQGAQIAAQRSQHIEDGRQYVDTKRAEIDVLLNTAKQSATNAEAQFQASRTTADNLNNLYASAQTVKATTDSIAEAVTALRQKSEEHTATAKKLADVADVTEQRVTAYESRLEALLEAANDRLKTIDGLLPGAASAGLASAFGRRKEHFKWPQRVWQSAFVLSVLALLGLGAWEFGWRTGAENPLTYERLGMSLLHRLPLALPLIWLALYAARQAGNAKKVEEDYAFKETVSRSFEGYRREMSQIEGTVTSGSPLATLCSSTLDVITRLPGRVYEKHRSDVSPATALADSAAPLAEAASTIFPGKRSI